MTTQAFKSGRFCLALPVFVLALADASSSYARTCPADLTALASQIQTPGLQARLSLPMATIIQSAGGVDPALARTRAALADAQGRRAIAVSNGRDTQAMDDAIVVLTHQIAALECIKG